MILGGWTTGIRVAFAAMLAAASMPSSSNVITSALTIDGIGARPRLADVQIRHGRIVKIGRVVPRRGEAIVRGTGLVLAPRFIDTHSHHDRGLTADRLATAAVAQGLTTIIVGQDGPAVRPLAPCFEQFARNPGAVNVASYAGHNSLRAEILGHDSARPASSAEHARMAELLQKDMVAGALGLSTGLEYDPGRSSDSSEIQALATVSARAGGRYISHLRSEDRDLWAAIDEIIAIGNATRHPVQISHAKLALLPRWGQADRLLAKRWADERPTGARPGKIIRRGQTS